MKRTEVALLALVRAGLWGKADDAFDSNAFPLSSSEWREVLEMARKQTVVGLACGGINYLKEDKLPPADVMFEWVAEVDAIERQNKKMWAKTKELFSIWQEAGLKPVLLKGQGVAMMYDNPWVRTSGDVDVWFEDGILPKGDELGEDVRYEKQYDGSKEFSWKGLIVEIHPYALDINSYWRQKQVREVLKRNRCVSCDGVNVPGAEMNLLLQSAHVLKHAMGKGVGLRQLCDLARTSWALKDEIDIEAMRRTYKSVGIAKWNEVLYGLMVKYLGLPLQYSPYRNSSDADIDWLMNKVNRNGNFGRAGVKDGKLQTVMEYIKTMQFSMRIAPAETISMIMMLIKGQFVRGEI